MQITVTGTVVAVTEDRKGVPVFAVKLGEKTAKNGKVYEDVVACRAWSQGIQQQARDLQPGAQVKVAADVKSREWEGRYFTDVDAFRIEVTSAAKGGGGTHRKVDATAPSESDDDDSTVPF